MCVCVCVCVSERDREREKERKRERERQREREREREEEEERGGYQQREKGASFVCLQVCVFVCMFACVCVFVCGCVCVRGSWLSSSSLFLECSSFLFRKPYHHQPREREGMTWREGGREDRKCEGEVGLAGFRLS